ncbi:MAG: cytochrome c oxidase subunit II [Burkholderiales bacterium]|nr:cytochrome c oxidase subunit II [Burkholderiales bacterium]
MSDALDAAGPQAAWIARLWWISLWLCVAVFIGVMAALAWALWRARRAAATGDPGGNAPPGKDRALRVLVGSATLLSSVLLVGLLEVSVLTDRGLARLPRGDALSIRVTAHQWWWEMVYEDDRADHVFATANELVIPVGRPVVVTLEADDVIHSFWVPNLHGKKDLIPGRSTTIEFRADRAGRFVGRCAEFCGLQHAFMAYDVVALPPDRYAQWADHERAAAPEPRAADAVRGRELFLTGSCMLCHAVQGTSAQGRRGPDLTHFASRSHIGAGSIANSPQALARWIEDPQKLKPGANMPSHFLPADDLAALVAYLETLT